MGNRPKPSGLRNLQGNPGKRAINKDEPQPEPVRPQRPTFLKGLAKREWNSKIDELDRLGIVTIVDGAAFAGYCQCYRRWIEAEREIERHGQIIYIEKKDDDGKFHLLRAMKNPACNVAKEMMQQMRAFAAELGITPASRTRVSAKPKRPLNGDEKQSPLKAFLNRRRTSEKVVN